MVNRSGSRNDDVRGNVVGSQEFSDLGFGNRVQVFSLSINGLSHIVVTIRRIVNRFHSGGHLIKVGVRSGSDDFFSFGFNLIFIEERVGEHIS